MSDGRRWGLDPLIFLGELVLRPALPVVRVEHAAALQQAVHDLASQAVIGLDVETTLTDQRLCLVQVATPQRTYLIDPLAIHDLRPLAPIFAAKSPIKVIHYATFERRVLGAEGFELGGVVDTHQCSRRAYGVKAEGGHSLAALCRRALGRVLDKGEQSSPWHRRPLTTSQLNYAALDAEVLLKLYAHFQSMGVV